MRSGCSRSRCARRFRESPTVSPLLLKNYTASSCIGIGVAATLASLLEQRSGLEKCAFETVNIDTHIGEVPGVDAQRVPADLHRFDCRNNRLAELALNQDGFYDAVQRAAQRWGRRRVGVLLGTSTAGILQTELAYRERDPVSGALPLGFEYGGTHNSFSVVDYIRRRCRLEGPAVAVSCACASSAKVFSSARRMIEAGLIDAALVGGVDSLCLTTLYGFHSLQLSSPTPCRPFDVARDGISIGEAAAFALLERLPDAMSGDSVLLLGTGESSDAYHMSAPHPEGLGARRAMLAALTAAQLCPGDIDYINLHGTGTPSNDRSESQAVTGVFGPTTPCSSTKGATGHTLGAAGALEAVISALAIEHDLMPGGVRSTKIDPTLTAHYIRDNRRTRVSRVLSNSFGFGGTNCSLIFGRADA
jgi:3-oxoacyl-[acyl-carrier-protein] synthase-1